MDLDDLLQEMDRATSPTRRTRRTTQPPQDDYMNSQPSKPIESGRQSAQFQDIDSILQSDFPVLPVVPRRKQDAQIIDESQKQKMKEVFQLKPPIAKEPIQPIQSSLNVQNSQNSVMDDNNTDFQLDVGVSRRNNRRMLSQRPDTGKSDMNSSVEKQPQNKEFENMLNQSDSFNKFQVQPVKVQPEQQKNTFYEDQIKILKKEKEESIEQVTKNYQAQLESERKARTELVTQLQDMLEKERKRLTENHQSEVERLRREFELEKQRAIELVRQEPAALKQQIEQQYKMNELADQLKNHTNNLGVLKKEIEHNTQVQTQEQIKLIKEREQQNHEKELKLQREQQFLESEKTRVQSQYDDLSRREQMFQSYTQGEKDSIKNEKLVLTDIREQLRNLEMETKKRIEHERDLLQKQQQDLDSYKNDMQQQFLSKQRVLDLEKITFEQEKQQYRDFTQKNNELIKQKYDEVEKQSTRLSNLEMHVMAKQREQDLKEHQIQSMHTELSRKLALLENERQQLLHKLREIGDREQQYTKEIVDVNQFRQTYQQEKELIQKQKDELLRQQISFQQDKLQVTNEKQQLTIMHKTLANLRSDIAQQTTTTNFSQTQQNFPKPIKGKTEKHKSVQNTSSQNFNVQGYVNYLKNVDNVGRTSVGFQQ